jgi:hypothetical protein
LESVSCRLISKAPPNVIAAIKGHPAAPLAPALILNTMIDLSNDGKKRSGDYVI